MEQTPHREPGTTRVLVVEDNDVLLEIVSAAFERRGLSVVKATTGEEALSILREQASAIDWLFTDISLPGVVNGWIVADEYRLSHPLRPVIYASASTADRRRIVMGGIFVEKPVPLDEIARLADMIAGGPGLVAGVSPEDAARWQTPRAGRAAFARRRSASR